MNRSVLVAVSLVAALGVSDRAAAAAVTRVDTVEHIFGASNVNAVAGHGGLTAGISREGDVTVLTWPSPSCCDQLSYLASNAFDVRSLPHLGAKEGMGITTGIAIEDGGAALTTWLHDGSWSISQSYLDDVSLLPVTTFTSSSLDLTVVITDSILPTEDVLQRRVTLTKGPSAPSGQYALLLLANLSPTLSEVPELPLADWAADIGNDFAAVWDARSQSVLQFHPANQGTKHAFADLIEPPAVSYGSFAAALSAAGDDPQVAASLAAGLDGEFGPGVFAAITTLPAPTEHEVGYDATDFCGAINALADNLEALPDAGFTLPIPPAAADLFRCTDPMPGLIASNGWLHAAPDARLDADGGHLTGSSYAAGQVDVALRAELDSGTVTVRVAFAATAIGATGVLRNLPSPTDFEASDQAAWSDWSTSLLLPKQVGSSAVPGGTAEAVTRTATRALLHDAAGTDRASGAMVASIARQAPYGLDWPRDGSFFDLAFDIAGDPERVTRRLQWAATTARADPLTQINSLIDATPPPDPITGMADYPAGAWEMNYYADSKVGGNIRFEIDNTALMVWSMSIHPGYLPAALREAVARSYYPALKAGADLLVAWRDPATGLLAPANEDDNIAFTQGLHGAVAVLTALRAAARLATFLGETVDAASWSQRVGELQPAILSNFYDPDAGLFRTTLPSDGVIAIGSLGNGDTAWLVWPGEVLPFDDPRTTRQLRSDLNGALAVLRGEGEGGQYLAKNFLAGAVAVTHGGDPSLLPLITEGITRLAVLAPSPDTQAYGEVYVQVGTPQSPAFDPRTSNPHLWEGTLTYLAAMALERPDLFDLEQTTLQPPPPAASKKSPPRHGCGCNSGLATGWAAVVLLGAWPLRRRARTGRSSGRVTTSGLAR